MQKPREVNFPLALALGVAFALLPPQTAAQGARDVSVLAGSCANCHGTDGRSSGVMASLAGRPEAELSARLKAFRSANPPAGTTVMARIAKGYSESDLDELAKYFSQMKAQAAAGAKGAKR